MVICLERGADLHMAQLMPLPLTVSCFSKIQIGFTFLVPAYPGSPGQRAVKRVYVCMYVDAACADCDELVDAESFMSWERDVPVKLHMAESGSLSEKPISVITALKTTADNYPDHPALGLSLFKLLFSTHL